jgi:hypothetical protein
MVLGDEEFVGVEEGHDLGVAEVWTDHFVRL